MAVSNWVTGAQIGQTVTFTSKNPTDPATYVGIVAAIVTPQLAPSFGSDLIAYNAAVQRIDTTVGDSSILNYFVLTLTNSQSVPTNRVFANEWITNYSAIQTAIPYGITIYDSTGSGLAAILTLLRANGYKAVPIVV